MGLMESMGLTAGQPDRKRKNISVYQLIESEDNFYDVHDLAELKSAIIMAGGVRQNLIVEPADGGKYRVISGHRRRRAVLELLEAGEDIPEEVPCEIETDPNIAQLLLITTNSSTRKLTAWERIEQYKRLNSLYRYFVQTEKIKGRKRDALAEMLNESHTNIARLSVISKNLIPDFEAMLKNGRLGISAAYETAKLAPNQQEALLKQHGSDTEITLADVETMKQEIAACMPAYTTAENEDKQAAEIHPAAVEKAKKMNEEQTLQSDISPKAESTMDAEQSIKKKPLSALYAWLKRQSQCVRPKYFLGEGGYYQESGRLMEYDYVGIRDAKGIPICEGDILQEKYDDNQAVWVVVWNQKCLRYEAHEYKAVYGDAGGWSSIELNKWQMIGRRFALPEDWDWDI